MTVSEYERRFRELSDFCPKLVADEVSKKMRFLDGLSSGSPSQGSSKRGGFSSGSSGSRGSSGDRCGASGNRFQRGVHTHGSGFLSVSSGSSHFQRSTGRDGFRSTCGVCGKIHDGPCQWDNVYF